MTLNLPFLYFVWTEKYCQPSPNRKQIFKPLTCNKHLSLLYFFSRLWSSTISRLSHHQYEISSRLVSVVTKLPHNVDPSFLDIKSKTGMYDSMKFCPVCKCIDSQIMFKKGGQLIPNKIRLLWNWHPKAILCARLICLSRI